MDMAKVGGPLSVVQVFTQIWTCQVHSLRLFSLQLILSAAHIWHKHALIGGIPTPEKYDFASWDYDSQYGKINVPNHQPDYGNFITINPTVKPQSIG